MVEVEVTDEFAEWYRDLDEIHLTSVDTVVDLLEVDGVALKFPYSSDIKDSSFRELRIKSHGHQLRVLYAFDPRRSAVLVIGGDKTGDDRFYERMIPLGEKIWKEYLRETRQ